MSGQSNEMSGMSLSAQKRSKSASQSSPIHSCPRCAARLLCQVRVHESGSPSKGGTNGMGPRCHGVNDHHRDYVVRELRKRVGTGKQQVAIGLGQAPPSGAVERTHCGALLRWPRVPGEVNPPLPGTFSVTIRPTAISENSAASNTRLRSCWTCRRGESIPHRARETIGQTVLATMQVSNPASPDGSLGPAERQVRPQALFCR